VGRRDTAPIKSICIGHSWNNPPTPDASVSNHVKLPLCDHLKSPPLSTRSRCKKRRCRRRAALTIAFSRRPWRAPDRDRRVLCDAQSLAPLVERAEDWQWSRLWRRAQGEVSQRAWLSEWPVERPRDWLAQVNRVQSARELEAVRISVQRGRPFGEEGWVRRLAKRFSLESTLRPRGRPKSS
jgi:hypothetical protein